LNGSTERRLRERGQVILMVGLATLVMFGIVGLAVDVGRLYVTRVELGRSLDAAALSGILELNGQPVGLTNAEDKAEEYFMDNETLTTCDGSEGVWCEAVASSTANELTMDATKSLNMIFLSVLGIQTASVAAHAKAGFGTQFLDAALVIDSTSSMGDSPCNGSQNNSGCPVWEAKQASKAFKDILLGTSPSGNVGVGVAAFRGCYGRPTGQTATSPMDTDVKSNCVRHDASGSSQVSTLISNVTMLNTMIDNINAIGGSGTNVCGGLLKGWEVLDGAGNHNDDILYPGHSRYLILLSDGDNRYTGSYTYQTTPYDSPHTYQTHPCRPPLSCTASPYNVGTATGSNPCVSQVYTPVYTVADDNFDGPSSSCPSAWNSGSGWSGDWTLSSTDPPNMTSSGSPRDTSCHAHVVNTGSMCRAVDMTSMTTGTLRYYGKYSSWESGDDVIVEVNTSSCTAGSGWTTLCQHVAGNSVCGGNTGTTYDNFNADLDAYAGGMVYIRFRGSMNSNTADHFYVDTIEVESGDSGSSSGYVNGDDNSSSCGSSVRRERQLDMLTWEAAKAIEAEGVEIFVVAFGVCSSNATVYTQAQCNSQIGNTDTDNTADQRLLKCMASSFIDNDHYYYATSASDLSAIFTAIANQIAHRLIE
jgi:Flp pilus assembly protein TadG